MSKNHDHATCVANGQTQDPVAFALAIFDHIDSLSLEAGTRLRRIVIDCLFCGSGDQTVQCGCNSRGTTPTERAIDGIHDVASLLYNHETEVISVNAGRTWICIRLSNGRCLKYGTFERESGAWLLNAIYRYIRCINDFIEIVSLGFGGNEVNAYLYDFVAKYGADLGLIAYDPNDEPNVNEPANVFARSYHAASYATFYPWLYYTHENQRNRVTGTREKGVMALLAFVSGLTRQPVQDLIDRMNANEDLPYCYSEVYSDEQLAQLVASFVEAMRRRGFYMFEHQLGTYCVTLFVSILYLYLYSHV